MFFGPSERPLFGFYHEARRGAGRAILLSAPVGHEYARVHRPYRQLATSFARAGVPTFRFDYSANGDSFGSPESCHLASWREDLVTAAQELVDLSGCGVISVVGVRLGATIAAMVERFPCEVEALVLWDPVVEGPKYLDVFVQEHSALVGQPQPEGVVREVLGTEISERFYHELKSLGAPTFTPNTDTPLVLAESRERPESVQLQRRLDRIGVLYETHSIPDAYTWDQPGDFETVITAPGMTEFLLQRLVQSA